MTKHKLILFYVLVSIMLITSALPQSPQRKDVPDKHKWNLADMYPTLADTQLRLSMQQLLQKR